MRVVLAATAATVKDFHSPNNVSVRERSVVTALPRFDYVFPAHSATGIELSLS